jgi:hypothetical protein
MVNMLLIVDGLSLVLAQMGPDFVFLESPVDHSRPPGPASLCMQVDQSERLWSVYLPNGIAANQQRVEIAVAV